jgi:Tfp pilus assembly protein PilN
MKAVNLIPADARKHRGSNAPTAVRVPTYALLGVLAAALALVSAYVLTGNKISQRQAQVNTLQAEVTQAQAQAAKLGSYGKFAQIAQTRLQTVTGIAATRFDWHIALADLSEVVPANTKLQTLSGTVAPGANSGGGAASNLRSDETTPALELTGCTGSQDDVARLMSRLRLIDGVNRVTLGNSQKSSAPAGGASPTTGGCAPGGATFDIVVFFKTQPGAGPNGAASVTGATTTTTKAGGSS